VAAAAAAAAISGGSKMPEFVRVKLMQVDFGAQSPARDPYCAVSIKEVVDDGGKTFKNLNF